MDSNIVDRLAHGIASATRRRLLGSGAAGALGVFGARLVAPEAKAMKVKKKRK